MGLFRTVLFALCGAVVMVRGGVVPAPLAYSFPAPLGAPLGAPFAAAPFATPFAAPFAAPAPLLARAVPAPIAPAPAVIAPAPVVARVKALDYADAYPQYQYAYNVQDAVTGDSKAQEEVREGDVVKGSYSLIEPDGVRRTVNYYADPVNGFNAVVQRDLPVAVAPVVKAAPALLRAGPGPAVLV